jgi:hypothetical protein
MANYDFGTPITSTPVNIGFTGVCDASAIISGTESFDPTTGSFWRIDTGSSPSATSYTSGSAFAQDFQSTNPPSPTTWVADDGNLEITPPFSVTFDGVSYSSFFIGTNGYITFGGGSSAYINLSASNPSLRKVMINAQDLRSRSYGFATYGTAGTRTFLVSYSGNYVNDAEQRLDYYFKMYEDSSLDGIIDYYIMNNDFRYTVASNFNDGTGTAVTIPNVLGSPSSIGNIVFTPTSAISRLTATRTPVNFANLSTPTGPAALSYPGRRPGQGQLYPRGVYNK